MFCIKCQQKTKVTNSRINKHRVSVWRRRVCQTCGYIFTTYEQPEASQLYVTQDGKKEIFDKTKLLLSLALCFDHLPHKRSDSARWLSETIIANLMKQASHGLSRQELAHITYQTLKNYDRLAAVQYGARHAQTLKFRLSTKDSF